MRPILFFLLSAAVFGTSALSYGVEALDTAKINKVTGLKWVLNEKDGVFKVSVPRERVAIPVEGESLPLFIPMTLELPGVGSGRMF